jgi:hypothetical protein
MTQNPGELYEEAQNAANKLEFKVIKSERYTRSVSKISFRNKVIT